MPKVAAMQVWTSQPTRFPQRVTVGPCHVNSIGGDDLLVRCFFLLADFRPQLSELASEIEDYLVGSHFLDLVHIEIENLAVVHSFILPF